MRNTHGRDKGCACVIPFAAPFRAEADRASSGDANHPPPMTEAGRAVMELWDMPHSVAGRAPIRRPPAPVGNIGGSRARLGRPLPGRGRRMPRHLPP